MTVSERGFEARVGKFVREGLRLVDASLECKRPIAVARRYAHLYFDRHFSPNEIRFFRLLEPSLGESELSRIVSKEELLAVQRRLNPPALHDWTEDKLEFHRRCADAALEVPRLFAALAPHVRVDLAVPVGERLEDLVAILDSLHEKAAILKPVRGVHGQGVIRLERSGLGWIDSERQAVGARRLARLETISGYKTWMLQERVVGHPALAELSATDGLQTCRIVTFLKGNGEVEILAARLRLICGEGDRDNFSYGSTGNVIANLDVGTGRIVSAVTGVGNDPQIIPVEIHPRTGSRLIGFSVPDWRSAAELAKRAARAFAPLRTIGWDVAICSDAPCLIEGNVTWDTLSGEPRMGEIYRRLLAECAASDAQGEEPEPRRPSPTHNETVQQHQ